MLSNSTSNQEILGNDAPGEASLLVSEFPPPPSYYKTAVRLEPPPIPHDALTRGTQRAAAAAARSRAQAERLRLQGENSTDAILGGLATATPSELEENDNEPVVAVFGEIVEDPLLVKPLDDCEDPTVVREQVKKLNLQVVQGFVKLVQDLVHRPMENKYVELSFRSCRPSLLASILLTQALLYSSLEKRATRYPIMFF
jgi:hypothetical protein